MGRRPALRWAAALLAGVVLATGCSGGSDKDALPDGDKPPQPVSFSAGSLWDERDLGMERVAGIELRGGTAIVAGDCHCGGGRLAVVDAETGAPRWVLDGGEPLRGGGGAKAYGKYGYLGEHLRGASGRPLVVGDGEDWTVLVQYVVGAELGERERGVAALSGRDGSVRWKTPLIKPRSGEKGVTDRKQKTRLLAADGRMVLASVESEQDAALTTVALDAAAGRELWRHDDGWAYQIAGDVVLGETRTDTGPPWEPRNRGGAVIALDAKTGQKKWDLTERFEKSELKSSAGGSAVVGVEDRSGSSSVSDSRTLVVNAATGADEKALAKSFYSCDSDARELIACLEIGAPTLVTIRSGGRGGPVTAEKKVFAGKVEDGLSVDTVWQDRIFVHGSARDGPVRYSMVDRAANTLRTGLPGPVAAVSERNAAFFVNRTGRDSVPTGLAVHRTTVGGGRPAEPGGAGRPTVQPVPFDKKPLWSGRAGDGQALAGKDTGLKGVTGFALAGDALIYTGEGRETDRSRLVVADAATGKVRWSISRNGSLGGGVNADSVERIHVVGDEGRELVLIGYRRRSTGEQGVAALSLRSGEVRWTKPVLAGGDDRFMRLDAADGRTFAVTVSAFNGSSLRSRDETIAFATGTRRRLWHRAGLSAEAVTGDLILTRHERRGTDLVALDASNGKRRWGLAGRYKSPELLHAAGSRALVARTADGAVVLDTATGRELARTTARPAECDGDGELLIVCRVGPLGDASQNGSHALTIDLGGGQTKITELLGTSGLFDYRGSRQWFFASRFQGAQGAQGGGSGYLALDSAGREVAGDLPGSPGAIGDRYAVFYTGSLGQYSGVTFTVHRMVG
ncbi:PQQ-binding-like beta-propeller repeat protein [Actinomadura sp. HBU206391]|uniref:outer membrane protein assembly factor BamB family protein n=1 Tax=Actinomadura sp. HBU206391 TaxID=2731692 RepID=UPI00164EE3C5|nr:PQQ-binding-like beta-propeller repeat protein [Actinomadura sp. HBU206391]MBC6462477.1 PQQ-binding-like beta-propeller repeat protein [Actinomadura sp. HBU206391]